MTTIHPASNPSMDNQETLGLENLGLDKPTLPQSARRTDREQGKTHGYKPTLQQQHTSNITSCLPSSLLSYQPLPIAPLGGSATTLSTPPSHISHHGSVQKSADVPRCSFLLTGPPSVSSIHGASSVRRIAAVPTIQSKMLVLEYHGLSFLRVDKQDRYVRAKPPLTEAKPIQLGRRTGSPPRKSGKAVSQPARSSQSMKTRDSKATPPTTCKPSPTVSNSKDDLIHLPAPTPLLTYVSNAHAIPSLLSSQQRLLLVLDLNGTLLYRRTPQTYTPRPCLLNFLKYACKTSPIHAFFIQVDQEHRDIVSVLPCYPQENEC